MTPYKTHPHSDLPPEDYLSRLILGRYPMHHSLYLETHRLILDAVPDLRYSVDNSDAAIGYGAHQFSYDGWGMAALVPHKGWVSLVLFRGAVLDDPDKLLEGTGKLVRHVKLRNLEELVSRREPLKSLIKAAASLRK